MRQFVNFPFPEALQYSRKALTTKSTRGFQIITESIPGPYCCLGLMFGVGSKNDGGSSGLAHISSQMLLAGTKNKTSDSIQESLQQYGNSSIQVTRDATWIQIISPKEYLDKSFKLISELLQESTYTESSLNIAKTRILQGNDELFSNPRYLLSEIVHKFAFKNNPMGNYTRGSQETIPLITRSEVAEFVNDNYTSNSLIVSASGNVEHNYIVDLAEKYLWRLPGHEKDNKITPPAFNSVSVMQEAEEKNTFIALAYPAASYSHPNLANFNVLQHLLSVGNIPARKEDNYFQAAMDIIGLVSHDSYLATYQNCGLLIQLIECTSSSAPFVGGAILKAMNHFGREISTSDLSRAKNQFFNDLLRNESLSHISQTNANQLRNFSRKVPNNEFASTALDLTASSLVANISEWVNTIYPVIAVYGNIPSQDLIEKFYQHAE